MRKQIYKQVNICIYIYTLYTYRVTGKQMCPLLFGVFGF